MALGRGFKSCVIPLYYEQVKAARTVLDNDRRVSPGSIWFDGQRLRYQLDLATFDEGEGPSVEAQIAKFVEREVRR